MNEINIYKPPESELDTLHEAPHQENKQEQEQEQEQETQSEVNLKRSFIIYFIGNNILLLICSLLFLNSSAWIAGMIATISMSFVISCFTCFTLFIPSKFQIFSTIGHIFFYITFKLILSTIDYLF